MWSLLDLLKLCDLFIGLRKEAPEMFDGRLANAAVERALDIEATRNHH